MSYLKLSYYGYYLKFIDLMQFETSDVKCVNVNFIFLNERYLHRHVSSCV
jgi:hypothetical protein